MIDIITGTFWPLALLLTISLISQIKIVYRPKIKPDSYRKWRDE